MTIPSRNCALVHTEATVVISLMTTLAGGVLPNTVSRAMAGLWALPLLTVAAPLWQPNIDGHRPKCFIRAEFETSISAGLCLSQFA